MLRWKKKSEKKEKNHFKIWGGGGILYFQEKSVNGGTFRELK
jgi:hypothetical protein